MNTASDNNELQEIVAGLQRNEKMISPKFLYDERGSQLFDEITTLPEYYPTETELTIMQDNIDEIAALIGPRASLIEYGSGSSLKTRVLLDNLIEQAVYVPVDISEEHLLASAAQIREEYPALEVLPVVADFTKRFDLPDPSVMPLRNSVYFPGSTIGNFPKDQACELLDVMYGEAGEDGAMLIGVDLQKDPALIEATYNDAAGVTAEFNLNMLRHLNREYGSDFDLDAWEHDAQYNQSQGRVEIRLINDSAQTVTIGNDTVVIEKGEGILTEYSHKYTLDGFAKMAEGAGFKVARVWTDADQLFSVQYCTR
jgi:dimethylhistidine N-methyltransferase